MYTLSELAIYPIKSIQGIPLQRSQVGYAGLTDDRRYMLVKPDGLFITGREHPKLTLVTAKSIGKSQWQLAHPSMSNNLILDTAQFNEDHQDVVVWESTVKGQRTHQEADVWFSHLLGEPVQLVYFSDESERYTSRRPDTPITFADGYPYLLTTHASLAELNRTCPQVIQMAQFRPNLVIQGNQAFAEDSWKRIRIGNVEFENVKPCVRCIFTTLHPQTAERIPKGEPLKTLGKFRLLDNKGITFGVNLIALNTGIINIGDDVEVLEYQQADAYVDRRK
ncbi:MOSC domain-containing protein [Marinomonas profundi]|uniref:MOSC domain-containing protein n=1 Tax=Marinomonas profundi TaxID=2726122 RepID=UPI001D10DF59|nr:MOSC domain-containing protein [Marinomonas profundi]